MFTSSGFGFLNINRVGWLSVFTSIGFDINRETNAGIDVVIFTGSKIIEKKLSIETILNRIRDDLYGWIVAKHHSTCSVNHCSWKRKPAGYVIIRCFAGSSVHCYCPPCDWVFSVFHRTFLCRRHDGQGSLLGDQRISCQVHGMSPGNM